MKSSFSVKLISHKCFNVIHLRTRIRFTSSTSIYFIYILCIVLFTLLLNFYSLLLTTFSQRTISAVPKCNMFPKVTCSRYSRPLTYLATKFNPLTEFSTHGFPERIPQCLRYCCQIAKILSIDPFTTGYHKGKKTLCTIFTTLYKT